jgi:peroxiredoxin
MTTSTVPEVGQEAPEFRLRGPGGTFHTLSEHRGHNPVVLVFFPLAFSPVCSHQLPELQARQAEFEAAGAIVYGISVDSHHANTAFARSLGLSFPLLSDWRREASRAYGVHLPEADTSGRATFVVGRDGRIVHVDVSPDIDREDEVPSIDRTLAAVRSA